MLNKGIWTKSVHYKKYQICHSHRSFIFICWHWQTHNNCPYLYILTRNIKHNNMSSIFYRCVAKSNLYALLRSWNCLPLMSTWVHTRILLGPLMSTWVHTHILLDPLMSTWVHTHILLRSMLLIFLVFCVVLLCVFTCCDAYYDFCLKTMFGSFLPPVVCRAHVLFMLFVFVCV